MAKLNDELKSKILDEFHIGKSQNQLAFEYDVSPATINKLCKGLVPKYKEKVNIASAIKSEVLQESKFFSECFDKEVNKKVQYLLLFQNSALKNQKLADDKLNKETTLQDLDSHSRITQRNKDTVLGKQPENIINNQQNNTVQSLKVEFV